MKHVTIRVTGNVQGVFFRANARVKAAALGLTGFVQNDPDGSVTIEAEGPEENLKELVTWCQQGPEYARVEKVDHSFSDTLKKFNNFSIQ